MGVDLVGVYGFKDGQFMDVNTPGADVVIAFDFFTSEWGFIENNERYFYFPIEDFFCKQPIGRLNGQIIAGTADLMDDDKRMIRGRLAELTGMIAEKPISGDEEMSMNERELDKDAWKTFRDILRSK